VHKVKPHGDIESAYPLVAADKKITTVYHDWQNPVRETTIGDLKVACREGYNRWNNNCADAREEMLAEMHNSGC